MDVAEGSSQGGSGRGVIEGLMGGREEGRERCHRSGQAAVAVKLFNGHGVG